MACTRLTTLHRFGFASPAADFNWHDPLLQDVRKVHGVGPSVLKIGMILQYYKYSSAQRAFTPLAVKNFTVTTDAVALDRAYFKK